MPFKDKAPGIKQLIDEQVEENWGRKVSTSLDQTICVVCGEKSPAPADGEYQISGIGTCCQDKIFGEFDEGEELDEDNGELLDDDIESEEKD